ncbi:sulfate transporter family protein [Jiella sp. MQZ9-1]|uniref:Sulfate transporter family protein n=1 Tax=Jiella flava TaxID=2816857 RepID=A0A939FXW0_9HYPH|nr:sulfate transporter family protein [Jiella flava]MBO0661547.1 sulfate transporter family protein [Jiella flava]MCD2470189.1 sulfate transporter family protein [Jiella flava]
MIFTSARLALNDLLSPPFRATLWKSLGLTAVVLILLWIGVQTVFEWLAVPFLSNLFPDAPHWVDEAGSLAGWGAGIALAIGLLFLIGPISAIIAGMFLDDVAEVVERDSYPAAPIGRPLPVLQGLFLSIKFFGVVILGNLIALALLLVPGVNLIAFFVVNGYLVGREYFEFAAMRYRGEANAKAMRARHAPTIFVAGLLVALFMAIPIVNLLTPLFAAALMVHLHQRISAKDGDFPSLDRAAGVRPPSPMAADRAAKA